MVNGKKVMCIKQNTNDRSLSMKLPLSLHSENDSSSSANDSEPKSLQVPLSPVSSLPITPRRRDRKLKKKGKSVQFNQSVTSRPYLHKNNYTRQETNNCWYSTNEFELIRNNLLKTLRLMRTGDLIEDDGDCVSVATTDTAESLTTKHTSSSAIHNVFCARGLENFNTKGSLKSSVQKLRQNAIWAVLEEQDLQVDRAECLNLSYLFYNHDALRDVYRDFTKAAAAKARRSGIVDCAAVAGKPKPLKSSFKHKTFRRKLFKKSDSDKNLQKTSSSQENSPTKPRRQQRRWSLLSSRPSIKSANGPHGGTAMMA